ncbi:MAG TPA: D-alanyl-D-alanine carboxypeptidase family protein [Candidatus Binatia bacterium]|nr:D-alanyl-D-alanine carboxypeptidase family protein [Candidatus Binatia bacterium]
MTMRRTIAECRWTRRALAAILVAPLASALVAVAIAPARAARRPHAAAKPAQQSPEEGPSEGAAAKGTRRPNLPFHPQAPYKAAILIDRDSGRVLYAENEHLPWPPASMVKMMTLLLAIEAVKQGQMTLDDPIPTSAWASRMGGSQVYLQEGETFPLREMLKAIMISSANDASAAVAERIGGSIDAFVDMMNKRAKELGLNDTRFETPHGLPPSEGQSPDLMSAADLATLGRELSKYPEMMEWASTVEAPFRNGAFVMRNTNHLIRTYRGADGLKTGYYAAAGFEVTATATRDDLRLLAVVLGVPTKQGSFDEAAKLLTKGFTEYRAIAPVKAGQAVGAEISVSGGTETSFQGEASEGFRLMLPRAEAQQVQVEVKVPAQVSAPVKKGQVVGEIVAKQGDQELKRIPVVAPRDIAGTSFWSRWFSGCQR